MASVPVFAALNLRDNGTVGLPCQLLQSGYRWPSDLHVCGKLVDLTCYKGDAIMGLPARGQNTQRYECLPAKLPFRILATHLFGTSVVPWQERQVRKGVFLFSERQCQMPTSKLQSRIGQLIYARFPLLTIRENYRPEWMTTTEGQRLELDFFIEELSIAFEVQGAQHYQFVALFHATYEDFEAQVKRDIDKRGLCDRLGIALYEVSEEQEIVDLLGLVEIERGLARSSTGFSYGLDSPKMRFLSNRTKNLRVRMGKTRGTIYALIRSAQSRRAKGKVVPAVLEKQFRHHSHMYKMMEAKLARVTMEGSVYYDKVIAPRSIEGRSI